MEKTQVIIVGGGPSGLSLGLALAQYQVKSVILERETNIASDPRGVWLTGDAVRVCYALGLGPDMPSIGHASMHANFHQTWFKNPPFFQIPFGTSNNLEHALPEGFQMSQPQLEHALRAKVQESLFCTLRSGCNVIDRLEEVPPVIEYTDPSGEHKVLSGQFLVGADGKTGIVRKHFLEPTAGIKQESGSYPYEGVWIASNIKITLPKPETHPDFPLWGLGYEPEQVYDLFWPIGWHFCAPPGEATATGRFGPHSDRTWRHEFVVKNASSGPIYSEELFWDHLMPNITLAKDASRGREFGRQVEFPRDCIKILRCRPFRFVHKCVNRWFHKRAILIGDAAHVFPPFAGQGVASGVRDAHQLAWRLALLLLEEERIDERLGLLEVWARERRESVDAAAFMSKLSGFGCNYKPAWWVLLLVNTIKFLEQHWPSLWRGIDTMRRIEYDGFSKVPNGFHLKQHRGGIRLAQVYLRGDNGEGTSLSDGICSGRSTIFKLLVLGNGDNNETVRRKKEAQAAVQEVGFAPAVLSATSIIVYMPESYHNNNLLGTDTKVISPAPAAEIKEPIPVTYESSSFVNRLGTSTRFAILRPDFFIFACANNVRDLKFCLASLQMMVLSQFQDAAQPELS